MSEVTHTNPRPYLQVIGHCYVEYGYPKTGAPQGWGTLGVPEVLREGAVFRFTGRFHKSRPVIYLDGRADGLVGPQGYKLLTEEEVSQQGLQVEPNSIRGWS